MNLKNGADMRVKICGITNVEDALLCCSLGADALGFIFYEKSKRNISYSKAEEIIQQLPSFIVKVGVFIERVKDEINDISQKIGLNAVQLYGDGTQPMNSGINLPVIQCIRVKNDFDFSTISKITNCSILLDTYSDIALGGTGESFDWQIIPIELRDNIILAGGISADNIEYIFMNINPAGVDLSSSVESTPGKKDEVKLKDFFDKINKLNLSKNE
ncbi:N-(5'-phosphoribosyl)anthranilate isomerase [bacterium]|nr:N-(5'-phosphoribosyl)anthranilate isomerase [bacterium]